MLHKNITVSIRLNSSGFDNEAQVTKESIKVWKHVMLQKIPTTVIAVSMFAGVVYTSFLRLLLRSRL